MIQRALPLSALALALAATLPACKSADLPDGSEIEAGTSFLNAFAKSAHKDEAESTAAWTDLRDLSSGKVKIKVAGQSLVLDPGGKTSEARLIRYARVTSLRDGSTVKGIHLEKLELLVGKQDHSGPAKLLMDTKGGKWVVSSIEME
jgi:hypothetical protein